MLFVLRKYQSGLGSEIIAGQAIRLYDILICISFRPIITITSSTEYLALHLLVSEGWTHRTFDRLRWPCSRSLALGF